MSLFRFNVLSWLPVLRVPLSSILVFAFVSVISVGFSVVLSSLVSDLVQNLLELFSLQCSVSISQSSVFFSLLQSQSQFQSRLFDSAIPYTNSGSALSLHSVKFVHVFASVIHCRILLRCRVYVSCFEPALLEPQKSWSGCPPRRLQRVCGLPLLRTSQKSWSGCPPRRLQRVCRCASAPDKSEIMVWVYFAAPVKSMRTASTPDKSEIRIVWVSSAPPAKSMPPCLCSRLFKSEIRSLSSRCQRLLVTVP